MCYRKVGTAPTLTWIIWDWEVKVRVKLQKVAEPVLQFTAAKKGRIFFCPHHSFAASSHLLPLLFRFLSLTLQETILSLMILRNQIRGSTRAGGEWATWAGSWGRAGKRRIPMEWGLPLCQWWVVRGVVRCVSISLVGINLRLEWALKIEAFLKLDLSR